MTGYRVAIDVGGTFIDYVLLNEETGEIAIEKEASTPDQLADQVIKGLKRLPTELERINRFFHGMTVGVNALVQERGAKVGLITTRGFRDVLEIGRGSRREVYNYLYKGPVPIVDRYLRREVSERLDARGAVLTPLDLAELDREVDALLADGAETIAIAFLHAYANPVHEQAAKARVMARHPDLAVCVSSEIANEWREYERTSTTVLNAFIQPLVKRYVTTLAGKLKEAGYDRSLAIMQSNGGVCSAETASDKPIRTMMSGPAGGVIGAKFLCDALGYKNVICADVGGTTYDVSLIEDGRILEKFETEIARRPIVGSLIDITSIGAGGGSIAWIDHRQNLRVGPQSAGARPGPVCFGLGGTEPTVTDAHLVLGRLDPLNFLGGRMTLDLAAAREAIRARVADPLGMTIEDAAAGIVAIAETNMAMAIRTKTVERGLDPREFAMLSYGGGGGFFAAAIADELGIPTVIIPAAAANFSAWGILTSDYIEDGARTRIMPFNAVTAAEVIGLCADIRGETESAIAQYGFAPGDIDTSFRADIRFVGQEYTLPIPVAGEWLKDPEALVAGVRDRFVRMHRQLYGHGDAATGLEIVSTRCRSIGRVQLPKLQSSAIQPTPLPRSERAVHFAGAGVVVTPIHDRDAMGAGAHLEGPVIIEEWTTTTVVPPGWVVTVDAYGNLILTHSARA